MFFRKSNRKVTPEPENNDLSDFYGSELDTKNKKKSECYHYIIKNFISMSLNNDDYVYYCKTCLSTFTKCGNNYKLQYVNEGPPFYILSFNDLDVKKRTSSE